MSRDVPLTAWSRSSFLLPLQGVPYPLSRISTTNCGIQELWDTLYMVGAPTHLHGWHVGWISVFLFSWARKSLPSELEVRVATTTIGKYIWQQFLFSLVHLWQLSIKSVKSSCPSVGPSSFGWLVGWSVCHNFLKRREATLQCSYRNTCYLF